MARYNRNGWLDTAMDQVRSKPEHKAIRAELQGHLEDKEQYFLGAGMEPRQAARAAVVAMGDPVEVGKELDKAHPVRWAKLYTVCKAVIVLLCVVVLFLGIEYTKHSDLIDLDNFPLNIEIYDPTVWGSEDVVILEDAYELIKQHGYSIDVTQAYWEPVAELYGAKDALRSENVLYVDIKVFNPRPWALAPLFMDRLEVQGERDIDLTLNLHLADGGRVVDIRRETYDALQFWRYWGAWYFQVELTGVEYGETLTLYLPDNENVTWSFQVGVSQ